ncbi:NlpC/P60 family protein [Streptomyces niveiscabiei]|uniref:C40 family peptidase n=1 Tax=Streptomyces niveiscabiei TaxID=164115 RepID=UPI0029BD02CA|nr:NlpC/P60 family protein [Streptomyces niveiscabiei]MDX3384582.1 NlpC/P60 family protein [Streptomyces niveiscabiei]
MAAHRKPRQRANVAHTARTAATLALAGAATATAFEGTGHAEPAPTAAQVKAKVDQLYREAEVATEQYNGAREKADTAQRRLNSLQDEAARQEASLNSERDKLGSLAAAQYRDGALDPAVQLALSGDPDRYLDGAAFAERAGDRQSAAVSRVRRRLAEVERLRGAARVELASLTARRAELRRHKETVTGKLAAARSLLGQLSAREREQVTGEGQVTSPRASRNGRTTLPGTAQPAAAPSGTRAQAPNSRARAAISYAYAKLGSPYVWGATGPDAFDCSGLIQAAYRSAGLALPRTTYAQIGAGQRVSRSQLLPGDLVFFYSGISHVGLYIGDGQMIHAPNPSSPVRVAPIDEMPFAGATRVA